MNLEEATQEAESLVDGLGLGLDPDIKYAVISFRLCGFETTMSCEGHMEKWGTPFPWVEVLASDSAKERIQVLLDGFYTNRDKNLLSLQIVGLLSTHFRVQSSSELPYGELVAGYIRNENILLAAREEMNAFATYLRNNVSRFYAK